MQELIDSLVDGRVNYLLDTCFFVSVFEKGKVKELERFCSLDKVGMSSFNLSELLHIHHKLKHLHEMRSFLKKKLLLKVDVDVNPGDRDGEIKYVKEFDPKILEIVPDASDAVLFVLAIKERANVITRDRHHVFTALAENYAGEYGERVLNNFP